MKNGTRLVRLSKLIDFPLSRATLYKWRHLNKYPEIFIKLGGSLFVDLNAFDKLIERERAKRVGSGAGAPVGQWSAKPG